MATAKSVEITNLDASPRVISEVGSVHGNMRVFADTIAAGTGDIDNDDVIMMAEIPSNAKSYVNKTFIMMTLIQMVHHH